MPRTDSAVIHPAMLDQIRAVAEAAMTGTCQLQRPSGPPVLNTTTGTYETPAATLLWSGSCRVQPLAADGGRPVEAGGQDVTAAAYQVTVPMSAPTVAVDDLWVGVTSDDPHLIGLTLRVTDVDAGDLQAERHLTCQDDNA